MQVRSRSGEYISVPVIPGAVLVNIADLMQRWTSDHFVSAVSHEQQEVVEAVVSRSHDPTDDE